MVADNVTRMLNQHLLLLLTPCQEMELIVVFKTWLHSAFWSPQVARPPEDREERQAYEEKKKFAISLIKRLPMDTRKLICVAEYFKHMEQGKLRKPEAFK